jgi:hypothetical protein
MLNEAPHGDARLTAGQGLAAARDPGGHSGEDARHVTILQRSTWWPDIRQY